MNLKYCRDLHSGLVLGIKGSEIISKPCCVIQTRYTSPITETINFNTSFKSLRELNKTGNLPEACSYCENREEHTGSSKRTELSLKRTGEEYDFVGPEYIELHLDYTCNLACMTCGPWASSAWDKYVDVSNQDKLSRDINLVDTIFKNLNLSRLKIIHLLGGEPFLSALHHNFLEYLISHDEIDHTELSIVYHSNGTVVPKQSTIDLLDQFKLVEVYFSIDATGEAYDYLRFPATWDGLNESLEQFYNDMPGNTLFRIEFTRGLLNIHLEEKLKDWFNNSIIKTNRYGDASHIVSHPTGGMFSIKNISEKHLDWLKQEINDAEGHLPETSTTNDPKMVSFIEDQDLRRNMDINKWFPEFLSFYSLR